MRVFVSTDDTAKTMLCDEKHTIRLFGEEFLDSYGQEIPDELALRYFAAEKAFNDARADVDALLKQLDK